MILKPARWAMSFVVSFALAWFVFMVPLGRFTVFEHLRRIASTDEAQELGDEAVQASGRLRGEMARQVGDAMRPDAGPVRSGRPDLAP